MLPDTESKIQVYKESSHYKFFEMNTGNIEAKVN
jgi:hypothetical protein